MDFYLHIGTEKTGTSSLQSFLDKNIRTLAKMGFGYTRSAGIKNNRKLSIAAFDKTTRDDFTKRLNIFSEDDLLRYQKSVVADLKNEIGSLNVSKLIFSSEHIQSRLKKNSEIQRLRDVLISLGAERIFVIIYIRRPSEIANSLYSTAIKTGSTYPCPPLPYENPYYSHICNHKQTLERFSDVFGKSFIVPRLFDKQELRNGSLIEDFIHVLGADWSENYESVSRMNRSLSATGLEILRRLNNKILIEDKENLDRRKLLHYFEKNLSLPKYSMPHSLYKEYEIAFKDSNEWIRQEWFPEKNTLFPLKEIADETICTVPESDLENISGMIYDFWVHK